MEKLGAAVSKAQSELGLDDKEFDGISYQPVSGSAWIIGFLLDGVLVGSTEVEVD